MAIAQLPMLQGADSQDHFVTAGTGGMLHMHDSTGFTCFQILVA